jgi:hypothetical protein
MSQRIDVLAHLIETPIIVLYKLDN